VLGSRIAELCGTAYPRTFKGKDFPDDANIDEFMATNDVHRHRGGGRVDGESHR
jgi:hypothetical protein